VAGQALAPELEGRDVVLTGVIARMPQHTERGWRLVLDVQAAQLDGAAVAVPPRVQLAWYDTPMHPGGAAPVGPAEPIHAGERWQLTARLKAPHGNLNPHGFDVELWLWEQGVGATGYVRPARATRRRSAWRRARATSSSARASRCATHPGAGRGWR
jgi:competence protein ComEC